MALANYPTFDPNRPAAFSDDARRNRAITDRIEPGSTFKLVAAVASIESGIVSMFDSIDTSPGWIVRSGRTINDTHPHGVISFEDVIALSSNVGFHLVTEKLDPGRFYQYARQLGFGQLSGFDLPGEVTGSLKRPERWSGTTLSAMSRGYEVDATALQLLTAYAALANGGLLVRPYVVAERRSLTGDLTWSAPADSVRRAFDRETAATILPAFEKVVNEGTAENALVDGLRIAGKTGTARKTRNARYVDGLYRATFVGFFPVERPEVAMIVIMDEPKSSIYGGSVSAPVFQRTTERWLPTLSSQAARFALPDSIVTEEERTIPDVTGLPISVARRRLQRAGLRFWSARDVPDTALIAEQSPVSGPWSDHADEITLRVSGASAAARPGMPDLTGLGAREAFFWLESQGIEVRIEGHGRVYRQSPAAGEPLAGAAVLHCK
jgi:cell division protein FtsI (penicillin-binding protein 3)